MSRAPEVSRRGFFAAFVGRRPDATDSPAPAATPPAAPRLPGLVPAGETFSLEAFYRARAEARAGDEGEPR